MNLYLDASALVKLYVREVGSETVVNALAAASSKGTVMVSGAEVPAALAKAVRMDVISQGKAAQLVATFWRFWPTLVRLEVSEPLVQRAADLAWRFGLRGYDAVHLASALALQDVAGEAVTLATFDCRLSRTAHGLGLSTVPADLDAFLAGTV
ncbi:MAG: type II toxin-antitoxin system VapC family toxin [Anaerolineae bacterium]